MPSCWSISPSNTGLFPRTESLLQKRKPRFSGDGSVHPNHICLHSSSSEQPLGCCNFLMVGETSRRHWMSREYPTASGAMLRPLLCPHNTPPQWWFHSWRCSHAEEAAPSAGLWEYTPDINSCPYCCEGSAPWKARNVMRETWLRFMSQKYARWELYSQSTELKANARFVMHSGKISGNQNMCRWGWEAISETLKDQVYIHTDTNSTCNKHAKSQTEFYNTNHFFFF